MKGIILGSDATDFFDCFFLLSFFLDFLSLAFVDFLGSSLPSSPLSLSMISGMSSSESESICTSPLAPSSLPSCTLSSSVTSLSAAGGGSSTFFFALRAIVSSQVV